MLEIKEVVKMLTDVVPAFATVGSDALPHVALKWIYLKNQQMHLK